MLKISASFRGDKGRFLSSKKSLEMFEDLKEVFDTNTDAMKNKMVEDAPTTRISRNINMKREYKRVSNYAPKLNATFWVPLGKGEEEPWQTPSGAPEARAYEYGSGIHATKGKKGTYLIAARPDNSDGLLRFWWYNQDKAFVGPKVDHPGVEARPYLKPSIELFLPILREMNRVQVVKSVNRFFRS